MCLNRSYQSSLITKVILQKNSQFSKLCLKCLKIKPLKISAIRSKKSSSHTVMFRLEMMMICYHYLKQETKNCQNKKLLSICKISFQFTQSIHQIVECNFCKKLLKKNWKKKSELRKTKVKRPLNYPPLNNLKKLFL